MIHSSNLYDSAGITFLYFTSLNLISVMTLTNKKANEMAFKIRFQTRFETCNCQWQQEKEKFSEGMFVYYNTINLIFTHTIFFICTFFRVTPELNAFFTTPLTGYKETPWKFLTDDNISDKATPCPDTITTGSPFDTRCWQGRPWLSPHQLNLILLSSKQSHLYFHFIWIIMKTDTSCVTRGKGSTFVKIWKEVQCITVTNLIILLS